jgi:hypothetical protein
MRHVARVSQNCAFDSKFGTDRSLRMRRHGRDARAPLFRHRQKRNLTIILLKYEHCSPNESPQRSFAPKVSAQSGKVLHISGRTYGDWFD